MILIISEEADFSTNVVIDWLLYYNKKFVRINLEDDLNISFNGLNIAFKSKNYSFNLEEITSVWYRRGDLPIKYKLTGDSKLDNFRVRELKKIKEYIHYNLCKVRHVNSILNVDYNKLIVSDIARTVGLLTPDDYIYDNVESIKKDLSVTNKKYSTKSISGNFILQEDDHLYMGYTTILNDFTNLNDFFFPSFIQNYISKNIELRVFYLDGNIWAMAIYSQSDNKTNIDFRNYNYKKTNRTVPYEMTKKKKKNILKLMNELKLNCGSLDLILDSEDNYYFLEVNPVGQFGMVSNPCNYYLHKQIAKYLSFKND